MMFKKLLIPLIVFILIPSQNNAQTKESFEAINKVWGQFYKAFNSLDYTLMANIHSKELIRISGGKKISDYNIYINGYKETFRKAKANNVTNDISLRFFERLNNGFTASERGIYKLIRNKNREDEKTYYGQFHVIFKKENNEWKIVMDYDNNYEKTIGEKDYMKSRDINDYSIFIKE